MTLTIYITSSLFAVEMTSGQNLVFREICDKERFTILMEELELPDTYAIKSNVSGLSEYMKIGKLKNMTPTKVEQMDKLDLNTYFNKGSPTPRGTGKFVSLILFFLGVLIAIPIMDYYVVQDMLRTREERISSAEATILFNEAYGGNQIDGTGLYAELRAVYNPFRIELFKVDIDGMVEVIFLHGSPSLSLMQMHSLSEARLSRGASVTVDERILYIYQLGGRVYDD